MYNEFVTPEILATFAGLAGATGVIVQFTKKVFKKKFSDCFVRLYTLIISLILTFIFSRNGEDIQGIVITIINSILIAIAAMGGYEVIADPKAEKKK